MKIKAFLLAICFFTFVTAATAQNRIKLFDAMPIAATDYNALINFTPWGAYKSVQVYLSCPSGGRPTSMLTGPDDGPFIVDNALVVNDRNVCGGNCFTLTDDPFAHLGMPIESSYAGVGPINVNRDIGGTGLYTFTLYDIGYTFGTTAVYLNTSCSIIPVDTPDDPPPPSGDGVICHRDNGNRGQQTITVGPSAVAAHLAHGDTLGPCGQ